jgi:hypothetical protein
MAYKDHYDNILGANNANNAYVSTSVTANANGSIIERLEAMARDSQSLSKNNPNFIQVTADMGTTTWNTVATHEILTVTGTVRVRMLIECTESIADADNTGMIQLGVAGATNAFIAATTGTAIDANDLWYDTTPTTTYDTTSTCLLDKVVTGGVDIGYEIATTDFTNGTLVFYCWWEPISSDGAVVAGTGGVCT